HRRFQRLWLATIGIGRHIRCRRQAEARHALASHLELQPPHVAVRIEGAAAPCGQEGSVPLVMLAAALEGLVVEASHDGAALTEAVAGAARPLEVGMPFHPARLDESLRFACLECRGEAALPVEMEVEARGSDGLK